MCCHIWHSLISSMWRCNCPVHNLKMYTEWGYIPLVVFIAARSLFSVLSPDRFSPFSLWTAPFLCSVSYWHDLIVLVWNRTKTAWMYCFPASTIVTRTRLTGSLTSALPLCFSNMLTQQLTHDLNTPHTHQQHAAVKYCIGWITWLLGKLLWCWYYRSSHSNTSNSFRFKCQNDNCTYTKGHVTLSFNSGFCNFIVRWVCKEGKTSYNDLLFKLNFKQKYH
jgi:hypothetical protein